MAATSGDLIHAVADCFGIPEETIKSYYRSLREAGFVTKSGRGTGAAKMASRDAAVLLVAAIGGGRFEKSSAVDIVKAYGDLPFTSGSRKLLKPEAEGSFNLVESFDENYANEWRLEGFDIPQLQNLHRRHGFTESLTGLLDAARAGELKGAAFPKMKGSASSPYIEVTASAGWPTAGITIRFDSSDWSRPWEYQEEAHFQLPYPEGPRVGFGTDLRDERTFSHRTIFRLADLLND